MKNIIAQKNNNRNNQNADTIRINKITKTFRSAKRGNRARMLKTLSIEITQTKDSTVKSWLTKFETILRGIK